MRSSIVTALVLGVAVAACSVACSQRDTKSSTANSENEGTVGLQLQLAPGITLSTLNWTISNATLLPTPRTGSVDVSHSQAIKFVVGGLASGTGYSISLSGTTDGANPLTCLGTATFSVSANTTSPVAINLLCTYGAVDGGGNGSISVNGSATIAPSCAAVTSLSASASEVDVGFPLNLSASGVDAKGGTSGLTFTWAITAGTGAGTFGTNPAAATSFTCTKAGPLTVTVTASVAAGGTCKNNTASVDLQCDTPVGAVDAGSPDTSVGTPDTGAPDTGAADAGAPDTGVSACAPFNGGAGCTPTEQRFAAKSPDCYTCMVNGGCLDDTKFGDTGHECGDVTGNAAKGAKTGTARSSLCLDTLDCILAPATKCASDDVNICYCGTLGAGNGCATAASGANGSCLQKEVDGLEHLASDAPSAVLPDYTTLSLGSGVANQLFVCAKSNGCDTLCSQ